MGTWFFPFHQSSPSTHSQGVVASPGQNFMLKLQQPQQSKCKSVHAVEQAALTSSSSAHAVGTPKWTRCPALRQVCSLGTTTWARAGRITASAVGSAVSKFWVLRTEYVLWNRGPAEGSSFNTFSGNRWIPITVGYSNSRWIPITEG